MAKENDSNKKWDLSNISTFVNESIEQMDGYWFGIPANK